MEPNVLTATVRSLVRLRSAELANRRLGEQWQTTFDSLEEGVALLSPAGGILRSNRAMTKIFGLSYGEIESRTITALLYDSFGLALETQSSLAPQEAQSGTRYFRFSLSPVLRNDIYEGDIFIVAEITEQKRAQAAF